MVNEKQHQKRKPIREFFHLRTTRGPVYTRISQVRVSIFFYIPLYRGATFLSLSLQPHKEEKEEEEEEGQDSGPRVLVRNLLPSKLSNCSGAN